MAITLGLLLSVMQGLAKVFQSTISIINTLKKWHIRIRVNENRYISNIRKVKTDFGPGRIEGDLLRNGDSSNAVLPDAIWTDLDARQASWHLVQYSSSPVFLSLPNNLPFVFLA